MGFFGFLRRPGGHFLDGWIWVVLFLGWMEIFYVLKRRMYGMAGMMGGGRRPWVIFFWKWF
jgi:hypothetical protein